MFFVFGKKVNLKNVTKSRPNGLEFANFFLDSLFFPHTRTIFFSQYVRTIMVTKYHSYIFPVFLKKGKAVFV